MSGAAPEPTSCLLQSLTQGNGAEVPGSLAAEVMSLFLPVLAVLSPYPECEVRWSCKQGGRGMSLVL